MKKLKHTREIHDKKKLEQKRQFDRRHKARPKVINIGDKVIIKQRKTTTQPPYNIEALTVTKVNGNQVTATNGEYTRVRDKNKLKKVPKRPTTTQPQPTSQPQPTTSHQESDLDIDISKISDVQQTIRNETEEEMNARLRILMQEADTRIAEGEHSNNASTTSTSTDQRVTRSAGKTMEWNTTMNASEVLIEDDGE